MSQDKLSERYTRTNPGPQTLSLFEIHAHSHLRHLCLQLCTLPPVPPSNLAVTWQAHLWCSTCCLALSPHTDACMCVHTTVSKSGVTHSWHTEPQNKVEMLRKRLRRKDFWLWHKYGCMGVSKTRQLCVNGKRISWLKENNQYLRNTCAIHKVNVLHTCLVFHRICERNSICNYVIFNYVSLISSYFSIWW